MRGHGQTPPLRVAQRGGLVLGAPLIVITGQSVASVLIWGAGVLAGGVAAAGLVLLIAIADEARRPHPFP